jgi:hypothetical protein
VSKYERWVSHRLVNNAPIDLMAAEPAPRGLRRRADKLRFIAWANMVVCLAVGVFLDYGDTVTRWSAAAAWSVLLLVVCYARAAQMDRDGPVKRS